MSLIVLLTDFGSKEIYSSIMKGVIKSINPAVEIVDLYHDTKPQNVVHASFLLSKSYSYFPKGTIFISVVDPGVGSERKILCCKWNDYIFLAPNNGLLSFIQKDAIFYQVENRKYFLDDVSDTFHGRDIFAPVAANLSLDVVPEQLGRKIKKHKICRDLTPTRKGSKVIGKVMHIDRFGNAVTNLDIKPGNVKFFKVQALLISHKSDTYQDAVGDDPFIIYGSFSTIEISIKNANFAKRYKCSLFAPVFAEIER
ncbi:MAG: SAM-dependent chlorinase/fluorinase [Planctomycetes bacterium]|nr:SAM-dependent chlorinase/fluorinase [Planctomycetota bacterium]